LEFIQPPLRLRFAVIDCAVYPQVAKQPSPERPPSHANAA